MSVRDANLNLSIEDKDPFDGDVNFGVLSNEAGGKLDSAFRHPCNLLIAVRTSGTSLGHDGFTVFSPLAAVSLPHRQVGTPQLRNAVFFCPPF